MGVSPSAGYFIDYSSGIEVDQFDPGAQMVRDVLFLSAGFVQLGA